MSASCSMEKLKKISPTFNLIKFNSLNTDSKIEIIDKINDFYRNAVYKHNKFKFTNELTKNEILDKQQNENFLEAENIHFMFDELDFLEENDLQYNVDNNSNEININYSQYFFTYLPDEQNNDLFGMIGINSNNFTISNLQRGIQMKERDNDLSPFVPNPPSDVSIDDFCDNKNDIDFYHEQEINVDVAYFTKNFNGKIKKFE